jgi:aromatic-L-amino-acid decarboxylase
VDLDRDPLGSSREAMREIGYRTIDLLVDRLTDSEIPAMRRGSGDDLRTRSMAPASEQPRAWEELLGQLERDVLTPMSRLAHRGYFAFIPASGTFAGALGDLVAAALDIDVASWMSAAGPSQLELIVLDWFTSWIGYPRRRKGSWSMGDRQRTSVRWHARANRWSARDLTAPSPTSQTRRIPPWLAQPG